MMGNEFKDRVITKAKLQKELDQLISFWQSCRCHYCKTLDITGKLPSENFPEIFKMLNLIREIKSHFVVVK